MVQLEDNMVHNNFDLFIGKCDNYIFPIEHFIKRVEDSEIGDFVNIKIVETDENTIIFRNLFPGSIQLIGYLNYSPNDSDIRSGIIRMYQNFNGVCVFMENINADTTKDLILGQSLKALTPTSCSDLGR